MGRDALLHFCDCKNLIAHQKCLLTWIQKVRELMQNVLFRFSIFSPSIFLQHCVDEIAGGLRYFYLQMDNDKQASVYNVFFQLFRLTLNFKTYLL